MNMQYFSKSYLFNKNNRWKVFLIAILCVYAVIISFREGDIDFFIETGTRFLANKDLYREYYRNSIYFVYSPVFSFLVAPFTYFPIVLIRFLWAIATIYFIFEICKITLSYLPQNDFLSAQKIKIVVIGFLFTIHFFNLNFIIGQMTVFMLYICLKSIYENEKGNLWRSAIFLSIGIVIKVMPIIILVYFFYNRNFKTVFATIISIIVLVILPFLFVPIDTMVSQYLSWFDAIFNGGGGFEREYSPSMHSLHSLALAYFTIDPNVLTTVPFDRNLAILPLNEVKYISYGLSAFLVLLTPLLLKRLPFTSPKSDFHTLYEFGYLCLITPLIFPMQQKYGFLFIFPAIIYLIYSLLFFNANTFYSKIITKICFVCILICFVLTSLSTVDALVGHTIKNISQYYKCITLGTIIVLIPYFLLNPNFVLKAGIKK